MLLIWHDSLLILYNSYDLVIWLWSIFGNNPFLIFCIWFLNVFQHFSTSLGLYYQVLMFCLGYPSPFDLVLFFCFVSNIYSNPSSSMDLPNMDSVNMHEISANNCLHMRKILLYTVCQTQHSSLWKIPPVFKNLKAVQLLCVSDMFNFIQNMYQCKHSAHMPSPLNSFNVVSPNVQLPRDVLCYFDITFLHWTQNGIFCLIWKRVMFPFLIMSQPSVLFSKQIWEEP
jgi:hypothetical protein